MTNIIVQVIVLITLISPLMAIAQKTSGPLSTAECTKMGWKLIREKQNQCQKEANKIMWNCKRISERNKCYSVGSDIAQTYSDKCGELIMIPIPRFNSHPECTNGSPDTWLDVISKHPVVECRYDDSKKLDEGLKKCDKDGGLIVWECDRWRFKKTCYGKLTDEINSLNKKCGIRRSRQVKKLNTPSGCKDGVKGKMLSIVKK